MQNYGLQITSLTLADDQSVSLDKDTIVVVTGPNNAGKTTLLNDITRFFRNYGGTNFKPNLMKDASYKLFGNTDDFISGIKEMGSYDKDDDTISINGSRMKIASIRKLIDNGEAPKGVQQAFVDLLDPRERLGGADRRGDAVERAADRLFFDEASELRISEAFRRAFGQDLILHRERSGGVFRLGERSLLPSHRKRLTPQYRKQAESMPQVMVQGAGMRSFARMALQLMTSVKTVALIDEPELFLHPPQVRHLARLIASDSDARCQMIIATHSEAFVKGVLDHDNSRVVVIRLQRIKNSLRSTVLKSKDIIELWSDPLLRTSNMLSALFHDVAVLMEGETDVRFAQSTINALYKAEHLPDVEYYSCNGKSKIAQIATALKSVNVPTVAVVDIDILQNTSDLVKIITALGSDATDIKADAEIVRNAIEAEKVTLSGRQLKSELDQITSSLSSGARVPESAVGQIRELLKRSSPWLRVKLDGYRGITDAAAVRAFNRVVNKCLERGLIINVEGELEGLCRVVSRNNKGEWLTDVLKKDVSENDDLDDARLFANRIVTAIRSAIE